MNSGSNVYDAGVFGPERSYPTARLAEAKQMQIRELQSALAKMPFAVRPRISAELSEANTNESTSFGSRRGFMNRQGGGRKLQQNPKSVQFRFAGFAAIGRVAERCAAQPFGQPDVLRQASVRRLPQTLDRSPHFSKKSFFRIHMRLKLRTPIFMAAIAVLSAGCASTPPVQPAGSSKSEFASAFYSGKMVELDMPTPGAEAFRAFQQGATGFVSVASVRATVERLATQQCARRGQVVHPIQETASTPPHVLGNFPRVEWVFECVDARKSEVVANTNTDKFAKLEKLKKLFDGGALTKDEFENEKSKLLALPQ